MTARYYYLFWGAFCTFGAGASTVLAFRGNSVALHAAIAVLDAAGSFMYFAKATGWIKP